MQAAIKPITRTGTAKWVVHWRDNQNRWHESPLTRQEYEALAQFGASAPRRPAGFTGNQKAWTDLWESGGARALGGVVTFDRPIEAGDIISDRNGAKSIALGPDPLNDGQLRLRPGDYTGSGNAITCMKFAANGITIIDGVLTINTGVTR